MDIVLRASVMFFILYGLLRILGKRELSQMTPFELVTRRKKLPRTRLTGLPGFSPLK